MPPERHSGGRSASPGHAPPKPRGPRAASDQEKASWSPSETKELLDFLVTQKAKAGDRGNFPGSVWTAASALLDPKTAKVCLNKYTQLCGIFKVIRELQNVSGWHWSDTTGASITAETKSSWDDYVKAHPKAKGFCNKGWPFCSQMDDLIPREALGLHVYRPSQAGENMEHNSDFGPPSGDEGNDSNGGGEDDEEEEETTRSRRRRASSPRLDIEDGSSSPNAAASQASSDPPHHQQHHAVTLGPSRKSRPSAPGPAALAQLAASVSDVSESLRSALGPQDRGGLATTPKRQMNAMLRAQQLETWLSPDNLAAFIEILEADVKVADAYNTLGNEDLRRAWVKRKLRKALGEEYNALDFYDMGTENYDNMNFSLYN
ncbi:hypothetical protein DFH07DRAFT_977346 [Mycena maculata]|uniref:Myb/SANT-like domain-containing protein n=1 Tax=Mycena maculata TaxID=230809 RepID=A0AAD7IMJ4_9AGAR|nr:hypothetical protein DFH07DRAFT_977346 [Mycena maculata]